MKDLLLGILFIVIVGIGGLVYRNAVEHPSQPIACPMDAKVCPDGTSVGRTGSTCTFPACPLPNISLENVGISFAIPAGFFVREAPGTSGDVVAQYENTTVASTTARITLHRYIVDASSTPLAMIQKTAIGGTSGLPVSTTSFSSTVIGNRRFTVVMIDRFEGVIDTAYYFAREKDVLRFDAIDEHADWTNPSLDVSALPAHAALLKLLATLQGQ